MSITKREELSLGSSIALGAEPLFKDDSLVARHYQLAGSSSDSSNLIVSHRLRGFLSEKIGVSSHEFPSLESVWRSPFVRRFGRDFEVLKTSAVESSLFAAKPKYESYFNEFSRIANSDYLEYGQCTKCDDLLQIWLEQLGDGLGPVVNSIFLKSLNNKNHLLLLLKAISNLPYESVEPVGQVQAMAYLSMDSEELMEAGIRAFENWEHSGGIDVLERVQMRTAWLERYRINTIDYLKGL